MDLKGTTLRRPLIRRAAYLQAKIEAQGERDASELWREELRSLDVVLEMLGAQADTRERALVNARDHVARERQRGAR